MDIDYILENHYVRSVLITFILLYTASIRPELPSYIKNLFNNSIFRIVVLFFIVMKANKDPTLSLLIAIGFVLTLDFLSVQQAKESFKVIKNISSKENL